MKISCTQENFNKGLSYVSHITGRNVQLPILSNVFIKTQDGIVKLLTTNLDITISCFVRGKVETNGQFTVNAKILSDYIHLLPHERVDIELKGADFNIQCGKQKTVLHGNAVDEFPLIPDFIKKEKVVILSSLFKQGLSQTLFSVSVNETRPEIGGVLFHFDKKNLTLVGTDSYRLAERQINFQHIEGEIKDIIVPYKVLQEVLRILEEDENIEIYWSEHQVLFRCGDVEIMSRLIDGKYPDYKQIIPKNCNTRCIVISRDFLNSIKTAGIFSRTGVNDVKLDLFPSKKELHIHSTNTHIGTNSSVIDISDASGDDNTITFNYRYLVEGITSMATDELIIEMVDDANPCIIRPKEKENEYLYIVMPIKQ